MPRLTPEWIGKTPDTTVPPRVRLRVLQRYDNRCARCTAKIIGRLWTCDHRVALILNGPNRESNLQPICNWCTPLKNADDAHAKAVAYRKARKHAGINIPRGRPLIGTVRSGWKHFMNGVWERR